MQIFIIYLVYKTILSDPQGRAEQWPGGAGRKAGVPRAAGRAPGASRAGGRDPAVQQCASLPADSAGTCSTVNTLVSPLSVSTTKGRLAGSCRKFISK